MYPWIQQDSNLHLTHFECAASTIWAIDPKATMLPPPSSDLKVQAAAWLTVSEARIELATSWSQTRRSTSELHTDNPRRGGKQDCLPVPRGEEWTMPVIPRAFTLLSQTRGLMPSHRSRHFRLTDWLCRASITELFGRVRCGLSRSVNRLSPQPSL